MLFFNNKRTIFLSLLALLTLFLLFYAGNKEYLQEKSADKFWLDFSGTLNQIVKKGDNIIYKDSLDNKDNLEWNKYIETFNEHIKLLNRQNEPHIKDKYIFSVSFRKIDSRIAIKFTISEKTTEQIIESKEIISDPIKYTSIIPAVVAIFMFFATASPIISLLTSLLLASVLYNGGSIIMGTKEIFYNYIPHSLYGNNFNIFFFLIITTVFLRILSNAGGVQSLNRTRPSILKYILLPLLSFHPYSGATAGTWLQGTLSCASSSKLRIMFISHILSLVVSSLLMYGYSNISASMFLSSIQYRFFSLSLVTMLAFTIIFRRRYKCEDDIDTIGECNIFKSKKMVKARSYMSIFFLVLFIVSFGIFTLLIGMIKVEDINAEALTLSKLKHYLVISNISSALVLASLISLLALIIYTVRAKLLNIQDTYKGILSGLKDTYYFTIILLLSFAFSRVLSDMGSAYYIISLFKVKIGGAYFPFICFIISTITSFMFGNGLLSSAIITPILLPIAGGSGAASIITAILEGYIAGELLSPYSPTTIMISSIFKMNPLKHSSHMFPFISLSIIASSVIGFMISGSNLPLWASYAAIFLLSILIMLRKPIK